MNHRDTIDAWVMHIVNNWLDKRGELEWLKEKEPQSDIEFENPKTKKEESPFPSSVQQLIIKLRKSIEEKNTNDAWHCIEQIGKLADHIHHQNNRISARMSLECGIAAYMMGSSQEAISFLTRAVSSYTDDHDKGTACWLLGCVYWCINNSISALAFWEDAYNHFCEQKRKSGRGSELEYWYDAITKEMEDYIKDGAKDEEPPPLRINYADNKINLKKHGIQTLFVLGQIVAGTPSGVMPTPIDFMITNQVHFNKKNHRIISLLRGEKIVNIPPGQRYFILQVIGNSMNQCTIEPIRHGDYVILREQNMADNNDIVAALILSGGSVDDRATLKRFVRKGDKIQLLPESDDPEFQKPIHVDRVFTKFDDDFQIRGVAVAVLKPL